MLCLTMSYELNSMGTPITIELVKNGGNIPVTGDNIEQYVDLLLVDYLYGKNTRVFFELMRQGLRLVLPPCKL